MKEHRDDRHELYEFDDRLLGRGEIFAHLTDDHGLEPSEVMPLSGELRFSLHYRAHKVRMDNR